MTQRQWKLLLPVVLVAACSRAPASSARQPPSGVSPYRPSAVVAWLDCVECTPSQLNAVASLGDAAVPDLRAVLLNGPSRDRLDRQRAYVEKRYQTLKDYERLHQDQRVPLTQQEYVQLYMQKYVLLNRTRSAGALGAINTAAAKSSLKEAQQLSNLPDALRVEIDRALR